MFEAYLGLDKVVHLKSIDVKIPLLEIYAGVSFELAPLPAEPSEQ